MPSGHTDFREREREREQASEPAQRIDRVVESDVQHFVELRLELGCVEVSGHDQRARHCRNVGLQFLLSKRTSVVA